MDIRLLGIKNESQKRYSGHRSWINDVKQQGWRYHMSDINAAIGISQLKRFTYLSTKRKLLCNYYNKKFINIDHIKFYSIDYNKICPHIYIIHIKNLKDRENLRKELLRKGIQTGIHYFPIYRYSKFKESVRKFPNTEKIFNKLLTLPLHPGLKKLDIDYICKQVINVSKKYLNE